MDTLATLSPTVTTDLLDYDGVYGTLDDKLDTQANATGNGHTVRYVTDSVSATKS